LDSILLFLSELVDAGQRALAPQPVELVEATSELGKACHVAVVACEVGHLIRNWLPQARPAGAMVRGNGTGYADLVEGGSSPSNLMMAAALRN
jgi:hypothetical protein